MSKILVLAKSYASPVKGLGELHFNALDFFKAPEEYSLVLFPGGADVSPELYGHTSPKGVCRSSMYQDKEDMLVFKTALKYGVAMAGICRGMQLLNVLNGGTMIHDLCGHAGPDHTVVTADGERFMVTSSHHQMAVITNDAVLLGWSETNRSAIYIGDKDEEVDYKGPEIEAYFYPKTRCFGAQFHPEWMPVDSKGFLWYKQAVNNLLTCTPEEFIDKYSGKQQTSAA